MKKLRLNSVAVVGIFALIVGLMLPSAFQAAQATIGWLTGNSLNDCSETSLSDGFEGVIAFNLAEDGFCVQGENLEEIVSDFAERGVELPRGQWMLQKVSSGLNGASLSLFMQTTQVSVIQTVQDIPDAASYHLLTHVHVAPSLSQEVLVEARIGDDIVIYFTGEIHSDHVDFNLVETVFHNPATGCEGSSVRRLLESEVSATVAHDGLCMTAGVLPILAVGEQYIVMYLSNSSPFVTNGDLTVHNGYAVPFTFTQEMQNLVWVLPNQGDGEIYFFPANLVEGIDLNDIPAILDAIGRD